MKQVLMITQQCIHQASWTPPIIPLPSDTPRLRTHASRFPMWHTATPTHFPVRPHNTAWHSDIRDVTSPQKLLGHILRTELPRPEQSRGDETDESTNRTTAATTARRKETIPIHSEQFYDDDDDHTTSRTKADDSRGKQNEKKWKPDESK